MSGAELQVNSYDSRVLSAVEDQQQLCASAGPGPSSPENLMQSSAYRQHLNAARNEAKHAEKEAQEAANQLRGDVDMVNQ